MFHMKRPVTRRHVAAAVLCVLAVLLLLRITDMTVIRPDVYRERIAQAIAEAQEVAS